MKKRRAGIEESLGETCREAIRPFPLGIPVSNPSEVILMEALAYLLDVKEEL